MQPCLEVACTQFLTCALFVFCAILLTTDCVNKKKRISMKYMGGSRWWRSCLPARDSTIACVSGWYYRPPACGETRKKTQQQIRQNKSDMCTCELSEVCKEPFEGGGTGTSVTPIKVLFSLCPGSNGANICVDLRPVIRLSVSPHAHQNGGWTSSVPAPPDLTSCRVPKSQSSWNL